MRIIKKRHIQILAFIVLSVLSLTATGVALYVIIDSYNNDNSPPEWATSILTFIIGLWSKTPDVVTSVDKITDNRTEEEIERSISKKKNCIQRMFCCGDKPIDV